MTAADLFRKTLPRLKAEPSGMAFSDALTRAVDTIFNHLQRKRSELIKVRFDEQEVENEPFDLPTGFRGLVSATLYAVASGGDRSVLTPLPFGTAVDDTAGTPKYFYLVGARQMGVSPVPDQNFTIDGWYYAHPGALGMSSTLPFGGLLDTVIEDAVVMLSQGVFDMRKIEDDVDALLAARTTAPRRNKLW